MNATGVPGLGRRTGSRCALPPHESPFPASDQTSSLLSAAQLKDVVRTLEKLNGNGRWKWLLHHRENKKLREATR